MRTFDILFKYRNKNTAYLNLELDGAKALKIMEHLNDLKLNPIAVTKSGDVTETLTLKEMRELIII